MYTLLFTMLSSELVGQHWQTQIQEMMTMALLQEAAKVAVVHDVHHHHHLHQRHKDRLQHRLKVTPQAPLVRLLPSQGVLGVP